MARYDWGWAPFGGRGYDRAFSQGAGRGGYDSERWRPGPSDTVDGRWVEGVYGPGRYGLGPYHERLRKRRRPDPELRQEVQDALFYDTWVDAEAITVEVKEGVVTLKGELPSYDEVRFATDDAWDVDGVVGVRSELTVTER